MRIVACLLGFFAVSTPLMLSAQVGTGGEMASTDVVFDLAKSILKALESGDWRLAAAFALILTVWFLRWMAPKLHDKVGDFLNGDIGGSFLVLAASFGSALTTARLANQSWSWGLTETALEVAVAAAGGYSFIKKLVKPLWDKIVSVVRPS